MDYELRVDAAGWLWKHSINRKGRVLEAGFRVERVEAEQLVLRGEARWQPEAKKPAQRTGSAPNFGRAYEQDVQRRADAGEMINPKDWDAAMNRDD